MNNKNIVAVVQARLGSTRMPNKILMPIDKAGKESMLEFFIKRLKRSKKINTIVLATTVQPRDDLLVEYAKKLGIPYFRGSEDDVLDRTYGAAKENHADIVIRVTSDCPLNDPVMIDWMVDEFFKRKCDYLCNRKPPTYPDGFDTEIFTFAALKKAAKEATFKFEREHVTPYISEHTEIFRVENVVYKVDRSYVRLTVDYEEDYALIKKVYEALHKIKPDFTLDNIIEYLDEHKELLSLNDKYVRDAAYHKQKDDELKKVGKK